MKVIIENISDLEYYNNYIATQESIMNLVKELGTSKFPICVNIDIKRQEYKSVMVASSDPAFYCEILNKNISEPLKSDFFSFENQVKRFQKNNPSQEEIDKKKIDTLNYQSLKENMDTKYEQN